MKKFFSKLIKFSIPLIVFAIILHFLLMNLNTSYQVIKSQLYSKKYELIVLGNSQAHYAVNPKYFSKLKTLNLANVSQHLHYEKEILTQYLKQENHNIKFVLISVDYHSLNKVSTSEIRESLIYYSTGVKPYYNKSKIYFLSPLFSYSPYSVLGLIKNIVYDYFKGIEIVDLEKMSKEKNLIKIIDGFVGFSGSNFHDYSKIDKIILNEKDFDNALIILKQTIDLLIKNNIEPILFSAPVHKQEYNLRYEYDILKRNQKIIKEIQNDFNIKYWDFMKLELEDNKFYNQNHLNISGAKEFSKILDEKINSINNKP